MKMRDQIREANDILHKNAENREKYEKVTEKLEKILQLSKSTYN